MAVQGAASPGGLRAPYATNLQDMKLAERNLCKAPEGPSAGGFLHQTRLSEHGRARAEALNG